MSRYKDHVKLKGRGPSARRPTKEVLGAIIQDLFEHESSPIVIAIGGPGGIGKTTLAEELAEALPNAEVIGLDNYKTDREERRDANIFGPHPDANKIDLIQEHLRRLTDNQSFDMPIYDSDVGRARHTETYEPVRYNIIEGEIATYRAFRQYTDLSMFIDASWRTQLETRLGRDLDEREYSLDKAVATFLHSNLREFSEHGAESKNWSDIHLFCSDDYRLRIESVSHELYEEVGSILHEDMEDLLIEGLIVPLLTPFDSDGEVDCRAFAQHLDWLAERDVRRVLVGGTTGEFFSLIPNERLELLKLALEYFPGLILFQVGATDLETAESLALEAEELGADGILSLPPFYHSFAPDAGVTSWLQRLSSAREIPFILYNFPAHTGVRLKPDMLSQIGHYGMKDSSATLSLIDATERYFVGGDPSIVESVGRGGTGFVSGAANVHPEVYVKMEHLLQEEQWGKAEALQEEITRLVEALEPASSIAMLKSQLSNRIEEYPTAVRAPLISDQ